MINYYFPETFLERLRPGSRLPQDANNFIENLIVLQVSLSLIENSRISIRITDPDTEFN